MILEFDKSKQLITPMPILTLGTAADFVLEFELPSSACYVNISEIILKLYPKGQAGSEESLLFSSNEFSLIDRSSWGGTIPLVSDTLNEYVQALEETTAVADGQFEFVISGNKIVTSQVFYVKLFKASTEIPGQDTIPTVSEMNAAIKETVEKAIVTHNADDNAHQELFDKYLLKSEAEAFATKKDVDATLASLQANKANIVNLLTLSTQENHYTYDVSTGTFTFDIQKDGNKIFINNITSDIANLRFVLTNPTMGQDIHIFVRQALGHSIGYGLDAIHIKHLFDAKELPAGEYMFTFAPADGTIKFISAYRVD